MMLLSKTVLDLPKELYDLYISFDPAYLIRIYLYNS